MAYKEPTDENIDVYNDIISEVPQFLTDVKDVGTDTLRGLVWVLFKTDQDMDNDDIGSVNYWVTSMWPNTIIDWRDDRELWIWVDGSP